MISLKQAQRFFKARQDWLGTGEIATQAEADRRAAVCRSCPKHEYKPLQEFLVGPFAKRLKAQLELKAHLKLTVDDEDNLHTCGICNCYMPLKVWMSLEEARAITPDWETFPYICWLRGT